MANAPSMKVLKNSAKVWNVELGKGKISKGIEALEKFFVDKFGEDNLYQCAACQHMAPENDPEGNPLTKCPYCDSLFEDGADTQGEEPAPEPKPTPKIAKKRGRPKKDTIVEEVETQAIELSPEEKRELLSKLETHVDNIRQLKMSIAEKGYNIGKELIVIHDEHLWKQAEFDSFYKFVNVTLEISRELAYKYMTCARRFTEDEFKQIGVKKGELIAKAPDKHQDVLMKAVKKGASYPDLKKELNKLEGKALPAHTEKGEKKLTLLGRIDEGEILLPCLSSEGEPVDSLDEQWETSLQITNEIELVIQSSDNDETASIVAIFRRIQEVPEQQPNE